MKLVSKILLSSLGSFAVFFGLYHFMTNQAVTSHLVNIFIEQAETKLAHAEEDIRKFFLASEFNLKMLSNINPPSQQSLDQTRVAMNAILQSMESSFQISAVNVNGREWLRINKFPVSKDEDLPLQNLFSSPIYQQPMLEMTSYLGGIERDIDYPLPFIHLSVPVKNRNTGQVSGVVWSKLSLQGVQAILERYVPTQGKVMLVKSGHELLAHSDDTRVNFTSLEGEVLQNIFLANKDRGRLEKRFGGHGATFIYRKFTLSKLDLVLLYYQPDETIYYLAKRLKVYNFSLIFAGVIFFGVISFFLIRLITNPLSALTSKINLLGKQYRPKGNVGPINPDLKSPEGDEVEQLESTFSLFHEQLTAYKNESESFSLTLERQITERTEALKITHDQLLHAEKLSAIGSLSASIAHEFNNPLFGVMNVLSGVKRRASLSEDDAKLVHEALQECYRMKNLIKDLQDFNRPTSGKLAPMDIHKAIESLLLLSKNDYTMRSIEIKKCFDENIPLLMAVADQIKQVILNLLNNAADACVGGGAITISTIAHQTEVLISVQDTGVGIAPEIREHIFEPFFTTKSEVKGIGLGLAVSYGIIKNHGGSISVKSEIGEGTVFTIILPLEVRNNERKIDTTS